MTNKSVLPRFIAVGKNHRNGDLPGSYFHMFLTDFCTLSALSTSINGRHGFFDFSDEMLRTLLTIDHSYCNDDSFAHFINQAASTLVRKGRAYIGIKTKNGTDNNLTEIQLNELNVLRAKKMKKNYICETLSFAGKTVPFVFPKERLIVFDLKELGFHRKYFTRLFKRIQKNDFPYGMVEEKQFDLSVFKDISEKKILKLNRRTYWNGRNTTNQFLSEAYLLYRTMRFRDLQWSFLHYMVNTINNALEIIGKEYGFSGSINIREQKPEYSKIFEQLANGELNYEQVSDLLFRF